VGTDNSGFGEDYVGNQANLNNDATNGVFDSYGNVGWAQAFTLTQAVTATDLNVWVSYGNVPSTFNAQITDSLGAGTVPSDVLFSGAGTFGASPSWVDVSLGSLGLDAGTYYLVLTSDTPVPVPALDGSDCNGVPAVGSQQNCYLTGQWGSGGADISAFGSLGDEYVTVAGFAPNSAGPALTDFSLGAGLPGNADFQLVGDQASATPEPGTFLLLAGGAAALFAKRKLAR